MQQIIDELSLDPDLKDVFMEFDQLCMDIDIPEPEQYLLENELENLKNW